MLKTLFALILLGATSLAPGAFAHPGHPSNEVDVIESPRPQYPFLAATFGMEGLCEVNFNLRNYGETLEIVEVLCSNPAFCQSSERAVKGAIFRIIDVDGADVPGQRTDIIYPITYQLEDELTDEERSVELSICPISSGVEIG